MKNNDDFLNEIDNFELNNDNKEELVLQRFIDEDLYPPRKRLLRLRRRKNIYLASSVLCTVTGVVAVNESYGNKSVMKVANATKKMNTEDNNKDEIKVVNNSLEDIPKNELSGKTEEQLQEAIEIAKSKLNESEQKASSEKKETNTEESNVNDNKEEHYYYNLEEKLNPSTSSLSASSNNSSMSSDSVKNAMRYWNYFEYYGYTYGIDPYLLLAISCVESSGDHLSTITDGSRYNGAGYGIMQIEKPGTITKRITAYNHTTGSYDIMHINSEKDVYDVASNIKAGAMIFAQRAKENNYNPHVTIQGYNYGLSGIRYAISYYLADGNMESIEAIYNGGKGTDLVEYIKTYDSKWVNEVTSSGLSCRDWYTSQGWKKFGAGGGNNKYIEKVLKFYKGADMPYIVKDNGERVSF